MKIGGITWWRNNYGSILQAYALQKYLRDEEKIDYIIINQYSSKMSSLQNLFDKLKTVGIRRTLIRLVGRFGLRKLRNRVNKLQEFVDKYLLVTENIYNDKNIKEANEVFDGFICGSDQIWNPENTSLDSMYWLGFAEKDKLKISYAPSIGISQAPDNVAKEIRKSLRSFDAISLREESGSKLINSIMEKDACKTVLDPTLLVDKKVWDEITEETAHKDKYIYAYMLKGSKEERQLIEKFSKAVGLPVVSMPFLDGESWVYYDFKFGDYKLWDGSPADFINEVKHAEYVFTDSFHCMVFSCTYHKPFFVFPKKGKLQMSRLVGLQELLGIPSRMISSDYSVEQIQNFPSIDWNFVDGKLNEKRMESREYLHNALYKGE